MKQAESIQTKIDLDSKFILALQEKFGAIWFPSEIPKEFFQVSS